MFYKQKSKKYSKIYVKEQYNGMMCVDTYKFQKDFWKHIYIL